MNKLLTKIVGLSLGLSMAIGVGVAASYSAKDAVVVDAAVSTYTKVSSLTAGDEVLIVSYYNSSTWYYLPSTTTSSAPTAVSLGSSIGSSITGDYDSYTFTVGGSSDAWTFTNSNSKTLYITSANNGIRIGDTSDTFSVTSTTNGFKMQDATNSRFVGVYNSADWRSYTTSNATNYKGSGEYINFYKKAGAAQTYTVSFNANGGSGTMSDVSDVTGSYTLPANGFTAPSGKAFAGWKANNTGNVIAVGGSYTVSGDVTFYAQWADAYNVTYSAGTHGSGSFVHTSQPEGNYTLLPFADLTGVSASTGYKFASYTVGGVTKNPGDTITLNSATSVTVNFEEKPLGATYDFVTNFATYASAWGGYAAHSVKGIDDLGSEYDAAISFTNVSKQSGTITDRPVIAAKSGTTSTMLFVLDSSVSASYNVTTVTASFSQWSSSKKVAAAIYKGTSASGTALDSFSQTDTPRDLSISNLNGDSFIVDFTTTETSNQQLGITSITIGLSAKSSFGTLDHIKVTSLPTTTYHVGENYDDTGLQVTAYDGADESTAAYKDVTTSVIVLVDDGYEFAAGDVPGIENTIEYTEDDITKSTSFNIAVYAMASYELVTTAPADWSGNYLLVGSYTDGESIEHTVAINSSLTNFDQPLNFKEVSVSDNKIETGQELEWSIASYDDGYSMQGKNGKYAYGNGSNRFMTSDTAQKLSISLSSNIVTITGATGYNLRMNSQTSGGERFGFYNTGTVDVSIYKKVESSAGDLYAQTFLGAFTCDNGAHEPSFTIKEGSTYWSWALLKEEYNKLDNADKEDFRLGTPSESGTNIQQAIARYDAVIRHWGEAKYENFMNRTITPVGGLKVAFGLFEDPNTSITIIVAISAISLTSVGAFFALRKRKENI